MSSYLNCLYKARVKFLLCLALHGVPHDKDINSWYQQSLVKMFILDIKNLISTSNNGYFVDIKNSYPVKEGILVKTAGHTRPVFIIEGSGSIISIKKTH